MINLIESRSSHVTMHHDIPTLPFDDPIVRFEGFDVFIDCACINMIDRVSVKTWSNHILFKNSKR